MSMNNNLNSSSESPGARSVSEDDFHTKQPHPCSLIGPSIEEQIKVIQGRDRYSSRLIHGQVWPDERAGHRARCRRGNRLSRSDAGDPSHPRTGRQGTIKAAARRMTPSWALGSNGTENRLKE
jgi:hypothetical protein